MYLGNRKKNYVKTVIDIIKKLLNNNKKIKINLTKSYPENTW